MSDQLQQEIGNRRTFAIISHPDAGKTTLTEKLLLYGGAIHLAGVVKGNKSGRAITSDWMELERQRGISITTSVLQFTYAGRRMNLLDTPGHNDFSEDTYRTLAAADSAVMLIDSVKGIEPQTIKLFQVCRMRGIPIVTFINKMDRVGRPPLELLDEIERVLGIPTAPMNWPVGSGTSFVGVVDRASGQVLKFDRTASGTTQAPMSTTTLEDPIVRATLGERAFGELQEEVELLEAATHPFEREAFLAGQLSPVFFGSAMTNFGVEPFLDLFVDLAPPPAARVASTGPIEPTTPSFSGFVFKIQANMDPRHRDRIAFVRVCSGKFTRGMEVLHARTGKPFAMTRTVQFLGQERTQVDEAYAGDILGVWDGGALRIGDTLVVRAPVRVPGRPALFARALRHRRAEGPAEAQAAQDRPRAAVRRGGRPALLRSPAPVARPDPGRRRRAAVRGLADASLARCPGRRHDAGAADRAVRAPLARATTRARRCTRRR